MPECACCGAPADTIGHRDAEKVPGGFVGCVEEIGGCGECFGLFAACCRAVGGEPLLRSCMDEIVGAGEPFENPGENRWIFPVNAIPADAARRAWSKLMAALEEQNDAERA